MATAGPYPAAEQQYKCFCYVFLSSGRFMCLL